MNDSFRLILKSLDLSVAKAAVLFGVPDSTMQGYAHKERPVPADVRDKAEKFFLQVEVAATTFRFNPERIGRAGIPAVLRRAVDRRIQEMKIIEHFTRGKR